MAITTNVLAAQPNFQQDLRSSLVSVGLQCVQEQCLPLLSVVGITVTYLTWIHMFACVVVLYLYMYVYSEERGLMNCVMAIASKAPEFPGHPKHKRHFAGGWGARVGPNTHSLLEGAGSKRQARASSEGRGSFEGGPLEETREGPVPRVSQEAKDALPVAVLDVTV